MTPNKIALLVILAYCLSSCGPLLEWRETKKKRDHDAPLKTPAKGWL
jgi:hypothetical protein